MATCKDCVHEIVCDALIKSGCPYLDEEISADAFCMAFRNKADVAPKSEVAREIFAGVKLILQNMADKYGYKASLEPDFDLKKKYRGAQIGVSVALHSVVEYEAELKKKYTNN